MLLGMVGSKSNLENLGRDLGNFEPSKSISGLKQAAILGSEALALKSRAARARDLHRENEALGLRLGGAADAAGVALLRRSRLVASLSPRSKGASDSHVRAAVIRHCLCTPSV